MQDTVRTMSLAAVCHNFLELMHANSTQNWLGKIKAFEAHRAIKQK